MSSHRTDSDFRIPDRRRGADKKMLSELVRSTSPTSVTSRTNRISRRRASFLAVVLALAISGGTAAAVTLLSPQNPTVRASGRCYARVSSNFARTFPGGSVSVLEPNRSDTADVPSQIISACAALWRQGAIGQPSQGPDSSRSSQEFPVPPLVACVLPNGEAAVFPGSENICIRLGIAPLASQ